MTASVIERTTRAVIIHPKAANSMMSAQVEADSVPSFWVMTAIIGALAALTRFLDLSPTLREDLRHRSWRRARADFDARVTARRYRELYEELTTAS